MPFIPLHIPDSLEPPCPLYLTRFNCWCPVNTLFCRASFDPNDTSSANLLITRGKASK